MQHKHNMEAADGMRIKLTDVGTYQWLMLSCLDPALLHRELCCDHTVQQKAPRVAPAELKRLQVLGGPEQQEALPTQSHAAHRGALLRGLHHLSPQPAHVMGLQDTASTGWKQHMLCKSTMLGWSLPWPGRVGDSAHARPLLRCAMEVPDAKSAGHSRQTSRCCAAGCLSFVHEEHRGDSPAQGVQIRRSEGPKPSK